MLMLHGTNTLFNGLDHIRKSLTANGLPEFLAYGNIVGEVIAPVFMIIGFKTRLAALIVAFNMLMSIVLAHRDIAFSRNEYGGWMIELNVFYMMTAIVVALLGAGKLSLSKGAGKLD